VTVFHVEQAVDPNGPVGSLRRTSGSAPPADIGGTPLRVARSDDVRAENRNLRTGRALRARAYLGPDRPDRISGGGVSCGTCPIQHTSSASSAAFETGATPDSASVALDGVRRAGGTAELLDLREYDLPTYDADHDEAGTRTRSRRGSVRPTPSPGTPMYHGSYSSTLKTALDYCGFEEFEDKTVGLLAVAGGGFPVTALEHLRSVCRALNAWVIPIRWPSPRPRAVRRRGPRRRGPRRASAHAGASRRAVRRHRARSGLVRRGAERRGEVTVTRRGALRPRRIRPR